MENQQERLNWLAGFIDGEGSFVLRQVTKGRIRGTISITNTHVPTLRIVEQIFDDMKIAYYVRWTRYKRQEETRYAWRVIVDGVKRTKRFLEPLLPYFVTKQEQANLMYQWCVYRLSIPRGGNYKDMNWRSAQNPDFDAAKRMRELNQNPQRLYAEPKPYHTKDDNGYNLVKR